MHEARYYDSRGDRTVACRLCPHACVLADGQRGICKVRENQGGTLRALTYAEVTSVAMDPIEKKPLYHFMPGTEILSLGTWGCNFRCAFCQNHQISQQQVPTRTLAPAEAARLAVERGACGVAFTYNEPTIGIEYALDTAAAVKAAGLKSVLVSNGFINLEPLEDLLAVVDAINIDIKAFGEDFYKQEAGGALAPVLAVAERASKSILVETTTLIIPGLNDEGAELRALAKWIAEHCGPETPAHLSAYTPRYKATQPRTPNSTLLCAYEVFQEHLRYVYIGNALVDKGADTTCAGCGATVIARRGFRADTVGMNPDGTCAACGAENHIVTG